MGLWFALILCIILSAFFSATETAYSACNRVKLKTVEGERKEKAQTVLALLDRFDSLLTTVLIGNNIANIVYGIAMARLLRPVVLWILPASLEMEFFVLLLQSVFNFF